MARDVTDLALLDGVIAGDNAPLPAITLSDLRLGVHREHFWEDLDSQTTDVMTRVLTTMTDSDAL